MTTLKRGNLYRENQSSGENMIYETVDFIESTEWSDKKLSNETPKPETSKEGQTEELSKEKETDKIKEEIQNVSFVRSISYIFLSVLFLILFLTTFYIDQNLLDSTDKYLEKRVLGEPFLYDIKYENITDINHVYFFLHSAV